MEVDVRKAKKKLMAAEKVGEQDGIKNAKLEVRERQNRVKMYAEETGRTRRYNRERIVTP
jgi:hypothetical protein